MRPARGAFLAGAALALWLAAPSAARAEDPLDTVDGTEGWGEIDTSAVDEAGAWSAWRRDLARWEAGRARLAVERRRMAQIDPAGAPEEPPPPPPADPAAQQARIEAARQRARAGAPDTRDERGQTVDDERPWRRR